MRPKAAKLPEVATISPSTHGELPALPALDLPEAKGKQLNPSETLDEGDESADRSVETWIFEDMDRIESRKLNEMTGTKHILGRSVALGRRSGAAAGDCTLKTTGGEGGGGPRHFYFSRHFASFGNLDITHKIRPT